MPDQTLPSPLLPTPRRQPRLRARRPLLTALLTLGLLAPTWSQASELDIAQRQWLAGQRQQAVGTLEAALKQTPDELKLRFALGVMRMEMGQLSSAQQIFIQLTEDFPDLADPYNIWPSSMPAKATWTGPATSWNRPCACSPATPRPRKTSAMCCCARPCGPTSARKRPWPPHRPAGAQTQAHPRSLAGSVKPQPLSDQKDKTFRERRRCRPEAGGAPTIAPLQSISQTPRSPEECVPCQGISCSP